MYATSSAAVFFNNFMTNHKKQQMQEVSGFSDFLEINFVPTWNLRINILNSVGYETIGKVWEAHCGKAKRVKWRANVLS